MDAHSLKQTERSAWPRARHANKSMASEQKLIMYETMHKWELYSRSVLTELRQCRDEGKDVSSYEAFAKAIDGLPLGAMRESAAELFHDAVMELPVRPDFPYDEPNSLEEIKAARPAGRMRFEKPRKDAALEDKIRGAWLGRICGCLLGKPVEGFRIA